MAECADPHPWYTDPVCHMRDIDVQVDHNQEIVFRSGTRQKAITLVMDFSGSLSGKDVDTGIIDPEKATDPDDIRISAA